MQREPRNMAPIQPLESTYQQNHSRQKPAQPPGATITTEVRRERKPMRVALTLAILATAMTAGCLVESPGAAGPADGRSNESTITVMDPETGELHIIPEGSTSSEGKGERSPPMKSVPRGTTYLGHGTQLNGQPSVTTEDKKTLSSCSSNIQAGRFTQVTSWQKT